MSDVLLISPLTDPVSHRLLMVFALVYLFTAKGYLEVSDTFSSLQTAEAIVTQGRLDIPSTVEASLTGTDGRSYSKYGIGLPLAFVPEVVLCTCWGGRPATQPRD